MICYIPAKLHSTRLPGKNLKILDGKPMFRHIVDELKRSTLKDCFYINTPDNEILEKSQDIKRYQRDPYLSTLETTLEDIVRDFAKTLEVDDDLIIINPTNPLAKKGFIDNFVEQFKKTREVLVSVNEIKHHVLMRGKGVNFDSGDNKGTQFLAPVQEVNWLLTGIRKDALKKIMEGSGIWDNKVETIETPFPQFFDVDTQEDFEVIKYICSVSRRE